MTCVSRERFDKNRSIPQGDTTAYMGDYDTLVPDTLKVTGGFHGAFANNQAGAPSVLPQRY